MVAALSVALMTFVISFFRADSSMANIPMLYLLVVIFAALFLGRTVAVMTSIASFLSFDYFFVDPRYQFTVQETPEWIALFIFLLTATVTGQLMALLRARAEEAQRLKQETAALAEASWAVASEHERDRALEKVLSKLAELVELDGAAVITADRTEYEIIARLGPVAGNSPGDSDTACGIAQEVVAYVSTTGQTVGWDGSSLWKKALGTGSQPGAYLPIIVENQVLGVLFLDLKEDQRISSTKMQVVESLKNHAAVILQRDKLMKAEAKAQALIEADRLKTALLSMVSHDFRSPLTSIKASASSLLAEGSPVPAEEQHALLQGVVHEADRLNRMVGNILDLSRLEAGAWQPRCEPTEIAELVSAALDHFNPEENKRIVVEFDRSIVEINTDSVQMVQVLKNLLENALKYSPGESLVELKTKGEGSHLLVEVLDRGPGLPKGEEQKVFEPFYRAPGLKESSVPGVGIGLAVCKGLVEANKGRLSAYNRTGGGSTFRVTLPLEGGTDIAAKAQANESSHN
jgi:two-component system sensor histidine kinase KdpD